ncbi:MAG: preprotein translocase subunit SecE [Spirochaetes bacterium GWF1_41_5]|nr:MAG: preprotein translocase subunit SecE [Spirochaetes bacterium GWF1_41_5]
MNKFFTFVGECKRELTEKTTWPSKDYVLNTTIVVIVSTIVVSSALGFMDYLLARLNKFLLMDNVALLQRYITPLRFIIFIAIVIIAALLYNKIKKNII